jgi:alpha-L-rhamnosidase
VSYIFAKRHLDPLLLCAGFCGLVEFSALAATESQWQPPAVTGLRCEYVENPLGIDVLEPRLSWLLADDRRGQRQTAYQVLVASSPDTLVRDRGDLWDSGKVHSDQSIHVQYSGKPLVSRQACWWKVRIWDKEGQPSLWS